MTRNLHFIAGTLCVFALAGCTATQPVPEPASVAIESDADLDQELSLARLSERQGKVEQATKIYQAITRRNPRHSQAHHRLGVLAAQRGNLAQAIAHFQKAESAAPPTPELLNDLGYAFYLQTDLSTARSIFTRGLEMNPQHKRLRNNLAVVMAEQGHFDEALSQFRQVVETEAQAIANLAYAQSQSGYLREAEANYLRVVDLDPTQRAAVEAVVQLQEHRQKLEAIASKSQDAVSSELATTVETSETQAVLIEPIADQVTEEVTTADLEATEVKAEGNEAFEPITLAAYSKIDEFTKGDQGSRNHGEADPKLQPTEVTIAKSADIEPITIQTMTIDPLPIKPLLINANTEDPLVIQPITIETMPVEPLLIDSQQSGEFEESLNLHFSG